MVTLHAYILRQLLKSFGLAVLALTALFTMGGGLYNILKFEGITTGDLFIILPMLIPVTVTITMPIAALFAATITYGQLAADNELVACRAAGINVHRVFLSAMLLAVFVALSSALSVNVLIPDFMHRIAHFAKANVRDLAFHRLLRQGYIRYGGPDADHYMLTAEAVLVVPEDLLVEKGFDPPGPDVSYFWVERPTFLMLDKHGALKRFSVAEGGLCQFNTGEREIAFTLWVKNACDYEIGKRVVQIGEQKIGPYAREIPFTPKPTMVGLGTLQQWRAAPWTAPKLEREIQDFLARLRGYVFYAETARRLEADQTITLLDQRGERYELRARCLGHDRRELLLADVRLAQYRAARNAAITAAYPTRYEASRARLRARPGTGERVLIELELEETPEQPVLEYSPRAAAHASARQREGLQVDGLLLPAYALEPLEACTPAWILDPSGDLPTDPELDKRRAALQAAAARLQRKISGVIHFRFSFASSALVTVLMGAMLGVIFRGSRALAAFGLACIPFGIVTILVMMGRQLTESSGSTTIGPYVTWGGLALVALGDGLILRFGVRR